MTQGFKVRTCLWFEKDGLAAARFYTGLVPDSALETEAPEGSNPIIVAFSLGGVPYQILNGGPHYRPTPAASLVVTTRDQPETDHMWDSLTENGGEPRRCGWLRDRCGLAGNSFPRQPRTRLNSANPVECRNGEVRRRADVVGLRACLRTGGRNVLTPRHGLDHAPDRRGAGRSERRLADLKPLHDGRGLRTDRQRRDRPASRHGHERRLIRLRGLPGRSASLTDVTADSLQGIRLEKTSCQAVGGCANGVRASPSETGVLAGVHWRADTTGQQVRELAGQQRSAQAPGFSDDPLADRAIRSDLSRAAGWTRGCAGMPYPHAGATVSGATAILPSGPARRSGS